MKSFINCRKCTDGWLLDKETEEAEKCQCLLAYENKILNELYIQKSNLPENIKDYDISSYIGNDESKNIDKLKQYINEFEETFKNIHLYIYGTNSTQKSTVLSWLGKEICKKGFSVYYCLMNNLLKDLCNEQFDEKLKEKIDKYNDSDLLIVDESFDKMKNLIYKSQYQISFLDQFLRNRIENNNKATIFISNIDINKMDDIFGNSIKFLIKRNCLQLEFKDSIHIRNDFKIKDLWK
jgi:DNA replication protein DnaC